MTATDTLADFRAARLSLLQSLVLLYVAEHGPTKNNTLDGVYGTACCRSLVQMQAKGFVEQRGDKLWQATAKGLELAERHVVTMPF